MKNKRVLLLGATGSIGTQTLDIVRARPDSFTMAGFSGYRNPRKLDALVREFPDAAVFRGDSGIGVPASRHSGDKVAAGRDLTDFIRNTDADIVVNGIAGSAGLLPSIAALESGKDLALANKESVVMGWRLLKRAAETSGRTIIPVDSEHSALFQLTSGLDRMHIDSLIITASGGAFRDLPIHRLGDVTPEQASTHPNWNMGRKITIDSASMANKGLEIIEAVRMFDFSPGKVSVLVHPESLVHAMVRTIDGCLYAQISAPDMRSPIQNALDWPDLHPAPYGTLDLAGRSLTFRAPDQERYPLLGLAYEAVRAGEGASVAYNAADEVAVAAFEAGKIRFTQIAGVVAATLQADWPSQLDDEGSIFETDSRARHAAKRSVLEIQCS